MWLTQALAIRSHSSAKSQQCQVACGRSEGAGVLGCAPAIFARPPLHARAVLALPRLALPCYPAMPPAPPFWGQPCRALSVPCSRLGMSSLARACLAPRSFLPCGLPIIVRLPVVCMCRSGGRGRGGSRLRSVVSGSRPQRTAKDLNAELDDYMQE